MSNTMINWRFWHYHLQVLQWRNWSWRGWRDGDRIIRWSRNDYHAPGGRGREEDGWRAIEFYEGGGIGAALAFLALALIVWGIAL